MKKLILAVLAVVMMWPTTTQANWIEDLLGITELKNEIVQQNKQIVKLNMVIDDIKQKLKLSEDLATTQTMKINLNEYRLSLIEDSSQLSTKTAFFEPTSDKYLTVSTNTGKYAVFISNVQKYTSGSKFNIEVVNLIGVETTGIKATVIVSPKVEKNLDYNKLQKLQRTATCSFGDIPSGYSKIKSVSVPDISPEKIHMIMISLEEDGLIRKFLH